MLPWHLNWHLDSSKPCPPAVCPANSLSHSHNWTAALALTVLPSLRKCQVLCWSRQRVTWRLKSYFGGQKRQRIRYKPSFKTQSHLSYAVASYFLYFPSWSTCLHNQGKGTGRSLCMHCGFLCCQGWGEKKILPGCTEYSAGQRILINRET